MTTKLLKRFFKPLMLSIGMLTSFWAYAQTPPASVKTYAIHRADKIIYYHQVTNQSLNTIVAIDIGYRYFHDDDPARPKGFLEPQLTKFPYGYDHFYDPQGKDNPADYQGPPGWRALIGHAEDTSLVWLKWGPIKAKSSLYNIPPGQTLTFSVALAEPDPAYLTSYFTVSFGDFNVPDFTAPMQLLDTQGPQLSVALTPSVLWPANNKLVPVTATIMVKDNYDPNPVVKLESISANEPLAAGEVVDAVFDTDDRSFSLMAADPKLPRSYTVTYSATDGSGNKTLASTTILVDKSITPPKPTKPPKPVKPPKIPKGCEAIDPLARPKACP